MLVKLQYDIEVLCVWQWCFLSFAALKKFNDKIRSAGIATASYRVPCSVHFVEYHDFLGSFGTQIRHYFGLSVVFVATALPPRESSSLHASYLLFEVFFSNLPLIHCMTT